MPTFTAQSNKVPKWLVPALGFSVSVASLYIVFRKFPFEQLRHDVQTLAWIWVVAAVLAELTSHVVDAWRWMVILSPAEKPTLIQCVQSTFIGLFANDVLPAKAGEVIRAFLLTRWAAVPLSLSLTSAFLERVFDGVAMVIVFFLVSRDVGNLPAWLREGMGTLALTLFIIMTLFLLVLFYRSHAHRVVSGNPWTSRFCHLLEELHLLGNAKTLGAGFALSFVYLFLQVLSVWCLGHAANYDFGLKESAFLLLVIRLGTMIPNAPGNIGAFQFFGEQALKMLMVESFNAKSFSAILYVVITASSGIVGGIAVMLTGLSVGELHKQAHHAHREHEPEVQISET